MGNVIVANFCLVIFAYPPALVLRDRRRASVQTATTAASGGDGDGADANEYATVGGGGSDAGSGGGGATTTPFGGAVATAAGEQSGSLSGEDGWHAIDRALHNQWAPFLHKRYACVLGGLGGLVVACFAAGLAALTPSPDYPVFFPESMNLGCAVILLVSSRLVSSRLASLVVALWLRGCRALIARSARARQVLVDFVVHRFALAPVPSRGASGGQRGAWAGPALEGRQGARPSRRRRVRRWGLTLAPPRVDLV